MMITALFIAPYAAMEPLIMDCLRDENGLDLRIKVGNLQEGVALAKEAEEQGVDVIISRGGTAKLIGEAIDLPVIDVPVSGYDMLRVLTIANDFPRKKAIVGFPNITLGAKAIIDLLEIPIDTFTINDEAETEPLLAQLKQEGYELIMGDVVTFEAANKLGLLGILIQSGREAILDAFKEAKMVSKWLVKRKQEIDGLRTLLQVTAGDFMVLSEAGEVVYEQWKTFSERPFSPQSVTFLSDAKKREVVQTDGTNGEHLKLVKTKVETERGTLLVCECTRLKHAEAAEELLKVNVISRPMVIHQSEAMTTCLNMINRYLSYDQFALIGQRGTGKELIAQYIHFHKFQGNGLFASVKAEDAIRLKLEQIDPDILTLYIHSIELLDELLRDELGRRLAALKDSGKVLIFSTIEEASLWEVKIYKDDIIRIPIPALAERKEDLKELVTSFILHFNQTLGTSAVRINDKGLALLSHYHWPGNVEELRAVIKDAVLMENEYVIQEQLIKRLLERKQAESADVPLDLLSGSLESIEKRIIEKVLEQEGYNQTKAAKRLQINRSTLWRKLKSDD
ncbi:PrpR N-terminal domain-containing protein [Pullulanibacillus sp. KACC 23026]|uniref:PrpR N-terminal domain-containing protein n=1 Tax=Pullulanibacillus sp. KACC 23026 TaxID=3028315 RepID=UPI0023B1948A|nr:PrpR N-terminal domain-containing protein [Pullulanibacillus sp. KACC 23026]WEG13468.1 PrpR N-terminal domain-containing protein [Pullulanibacillus sp. KACC 23026]